MTITVPLPQFLAPQHRGLSVPTLYSMTQTTCTPYRPFSCLGSTAGHLPCWLLLILLALCFAPLHAAPGGASVEPVRLGLSPVFVDNDPEILNALTVYLEARLRRPVRLLQRAGYTEMLDLLRHGDVDFAWICTNPYLQYKHELYLLAVPIYRGQPFYQSYIIAPSEDRTTSSLADLEGKVFAFADPDSNSGYLVVVRTLAREGRTPEEFFRRSFYAHGHRHVVIAVADGLAHGGAVESYVWEQLQRREPLLRGRTRVVERSEWFGFPPLVAGPLTSEETRAEIATAFLEMADSSEGLRVLDLLGFDRFERPLDELYRSVRAVRQEALNIGGCDGTEE